MPAAASPAPASSRWLFGPAVDLLVGCGLLYGMAFVLLAHAKAREVDNGCFFPSPACFRDGTPQCQQTPNLNHRLHMRQQGAGAASLEIDTEITLV